MGNLSNGSLLFFLCRNDYTLKHEFKRKDYRYTKIFPKPKKKRNEYFKTMRSHPVSNSYLFTSFVNSRWTW